MLGLILKFWLIGIQLLVIWFIVAAFIPGIAWADHVYGVLHTLLVEPATTMFYFFNEIADSFRYSNWDDNNPIEDFLGLLGWLGSIGLGLVVPLGYWLMWLLMAFVAVLDFMPNNAGNGDVFDEEAENLWHLVNARTTVQDTFDAEVEANAIASALKKHVK